MNDPAAIDVVVGRIRRAMGLRGEVVVDVITDEPDVRLAPGARVHADPDRSWVVRSHRWQSGRLVVGFDGVDDRTAAEALTGTMLQVWVSAEDFPDDPDEYYDRQLVGLKVRRLDGSEIGYISEITHAGAQDLLSVQMDDEIRMVPFVKELVPTVDVRGGFVVVADLPGLLDDRGI